MDLCDGECGEIHIEAESVPQTLSVPDAIAAFGDNSRFVVQSLHRTAGPVFVQACQNAGLGLVIRGEEFQVILVVRRIDILLPTQFFELSGSFLTGDVTGKDVSPPPEEMGWQFQVRDPLEQLRKFDLALVGKVLQAFSKGPPL